jgi:hypothetical protein
MERDKEEMRELLFFCLEKKRKREKERKSTSVGGDRAPVTGAMLLDVRDKHEIFFRCPRSLLHPQLITARWPPHNSDPSNISY